MNFIISYMMAKIQIKWECLLFLSILENYSVVFVDTANFCGGDSSTNIHNWICIRADICILVYSYQLLSYRTARVGTERPSIFLTVLIIAPGP